MFTQEKQHWWFRGKRAVVASLFNQYSGEQHRLGPVLDVGCGTGETQIYLRGMGLNKVMGTDVFLPALNYNRESHHSKICCSSATALPYADNSFQIIFILDVLYHSGIKDDTVVISQLFRILKPGGLLIITDSAFQFLYSSHDKAVHARQRYSRPELIGKVRAQGFITLQSGYYNFFLFPLAAGVRLWKKFIFNSKQESDVKTPVKWLNTVFYAVLRIEAKLIKWVRFPFGLSVILVAQKPDH